MKQQSAVVIVTPALAAAYNGNWQTARRWARFLSTNYQVRLTTDWTTAQHQSEQLMIALHARRSGASIVAWHTAHADRPLVLVLTGTDLYRDIDTDLHAQHSLQLASRLVVLNELGLNRLPKALRAKAVVCLQSSPARQTLLKTRRHLRALMVGHLREEKSPQTYLAAAALLSQRSDIFLDHIGAALDPAWSAQVLSLTASHPHYRWLGALPHANTRRRIQAAHLLVSSSRMEGGAQVVIEALVSGTPVVASRIDGHVGLLGADYDGYFEWGNAAALAALLRQARDDPAMLAHLKNQCALRAALFRPERERLALLSMVASAMAAQS